MVGIGRAMDERDICSLWHALHDGPSVFRFTTLFLDYQDSSRNLQCCSTMEYFLRPTQPGARRGLTRAVVGIKRSYAVLMFRRSVFGYSLRS